MGASTVKWGVARTIAIAWILTIPAAALIGFVSFCNYPGDYRVLMC